MARFTSVNEYMASLPDSVRPILKRVRTVLRKALPGAEEVIAYQIAGFRLHGRIVVYFAGWTHHYAIYPATAELVRTLGKQLAPYELTKGTIRFSLDKAVPVHLISRIAKLRAQEVVARVGSKTAKPVGKTRAKAKATPKPKKRR